MKHDAWKDEARPVLEELRRFIDQRVPKKVPMNQDGTIDWKKAPIRHYHFIEEIEQVFGKRIGTTVTDVAQAAYSNEMPGGIGLVNYPGEKHRVVTIWSMWERANFRRFDDDALWIIDQTLRGRPRFEEVRGPIYTSTVALNMLLRMGNGRMPDIAIRERLQPGMGGDGEILYNCDTKMGIIGNIKMRHNLVRAGFATHYPFAKTNGMSIEY